MVLVYQDGRTAPLFHYAATTQQGGTFTLQTDPTSGAPPGDPAARATQAQAGSSPVPAGRTLSGTFQPPTFTLLDCGSLLYWASPRPGWGPPFSCTFTLPAA